MTDLDSQIKHIRQKQQQAQQKKAKAEIEYATAKANADRIITRLREEFGVSSLEEAFELKSTMERDLNSHINQLNTQLNSFD